VTDVLVASLADDLFVPQVSLLEKVLRSLVVFVFLVVALRLGGKRELGQINVLDFMVLEPNRRLAILGAEAARSWRERHAD